MRGLREGLSRPVRGGEPARRGVHGPFGDAVASGVARAIPHVVELDEPGAGASGRFRDRAAVAAQASVAVGEQRFGVFVAPLTEQRDLLLERASAIRQCGAG